MGGCALFGHKNVLNLIQSGCTQGGLIVQYKIVKQFPAVQLAHHQCSTGISIYAGLEQIDKCEQKPATVTVYV